MRHIHRISGPPRRVPGFSRRVVKKHIDDFSHTSRLLELAEEALDAIALLVEVCLVGALDFSVALWRADELRSALPRSNRSFRTALIKKSNLASSGGTLPYFEYVTYLGVRRRNMNSLLRPIVRAASMEAIVLEAYSDDSLDRESAGHEKAISRRQPRFSSQSNEFFGMD